MSESKSRFAEIDSFEDIVKGAAFNAKSIKYESKEKKKILLYGIPLELAEVIEASGESFSAFARRACIKLAKQEGLM